MTCGVSTMYFNKPMMRGIYTMAIVCLILSQFTDHTNALQTSEDDRYLEKKSHELATWILSQLNQGADYGSEYVTTPDLCRSPSSVVAKRNTEGNYLYRINASKRNSELINSLLRLPKTMNEVGRK